MAPVLRSEDERIQFFDDCVPPGIDRELGLIVVEAFRAAADFCEPRYDPKDSHDFRGYMRRAEIESHLSRVVALSPGLVLVSKPPNINGTWFHTEVRSGPVIITSSRVDFPGCPIRQARFRYSLAQSCQLNLFTDNEDNGIPEDAALYAVLIYGKHPERVDAPGFAKIVFPLPDGRYAHGIDLLLRYPDLRHSVSDVPAETIMSPTAITLRPQVRLRTQQEDGSGL